MGHESGARCACAQIHSRRLRLSNFTVLDEFARAAERQAPTGHRRKTLFCPSEPELESVTHFTSTVLLLLCCCCAVWLCVCVCVVCACVVIVYVRIRVCAGDCDGATRVGRLQIPLRLDRKEAGVGG